MRLRALGHKVGALQAQLLGECIEGVEKLNPRIRVHDACAWMAKNTWACVRVECACVDGALFFSKFFYVFAPNQAFQTSKQLPKHHKILFNY